MSIKELIDASHTAIKEDASRAAVSFVTTGELVGATEVTVHARQHEITVDEPPALGGADAGANPVEHALIALASCQAITYRFWAAQLGIALDDLAVTAEGDLDLRGFLGIDEAIRPGFTAVRLTITPRGPEPAERYAELAEAVDRHCPVLDLFSNPTPVERIVLPADLGQR
jgi:putative redox protein